MNSKSKSSLRAPRRKRGAKQSSNLLDCFVVPTYSMSHRSGLLAMTGRGISFGLLAMTCVIICFAFADTVYFADGTSEKGLIVEEYYDRFVFNTADGKREILKSNIDEIFFDEPYQNNLYIGQRVEDGGDFDKALQFYRRALLSNPDFKEALDAIKGLEDARRRFNKTWTFRELRDLLRLQLGISLEKTRERIFIKTVSKETAREADLLPGDEIIRCWAKPLTYAGLKGASGVLVGLSNTFTKLVIERDVEIAAGLKKGDLITKIDNEDTRYMEPAQVRKKLLKGKARMATIRREVTLMRKRPETKFAMWVWHTKEALFNEASVRELFEFCKEKNIGILFFQLHYRFVKGRMICRLLYERRLKGFLKEAHSRGISVHALDGAPEFCLKERHDEVLAQLGAVIEFNKKVSLQERFDGVHYDNEPYLLPAFSSSLKGDIIRQFLELNRKCRNLIDSSGIRLEFGIDIPFWFDELDRLDAKLIDICDNVGIMDYRNFASGPDGIITHALDELKYAARANKKVFVGVETSTYPAQEVYFVSMLSGDDLNTLRQSRFEGFHLRAHSYEKRTYLGLVRPGTVPEEDFKKVLSKLTALWGGIERPHDKEEYERFVFDTVYALSTNPEFRDIQPREPTDEGGLTFLTFKAKEAMLEKLTFADMGEQDLNRVLAEVKKEFENYTSLAGFAIHHYKSYKEMTEKK